VAQKKSLRQTIRRSDFEKFWFVSLANFGAEEFAVALEAHPAAAEQVGHSRDRLLGVGGARTDSENQIAKRKFGSGLKDEVVFFHCCWSFDSIFGASVQS